jgi:hypothetical protein
VSRCFFWQAFFFFGWFFGGVASPKNVSLPLPHDLRRTQAKSNNDNESFPLLSAWLGRPQTTQPQHTPSMATPPSTTATTAPLEHDNWAVERALSLSEVWALVAEHTPSLVAKWRLTRVCKTAEVGVKESLGALPGMVVCGGYSGTGRVRAVWKLEPSTLRWEPMPALMTARFDHACCAVRGNLVVLGGETAVVDFSSSVEILSSEGGAFVKLPPLSCGGIRGAVAIAAEESDSALRQVLLLGGWVRGIGLVSTVRLVDLATGVCTPALVPDLLGRRSTFAAERLPDGRIVCAGGIGVFSSVYGPPAQVAPDAAWSWRQLPAMTAGRLGCGGCVMSDGRFAVLGGGSPGFGACEVLVTSDGAEHWEPLPPMHDARSHFACEAVARCIIAAGGQGRNSAEVYDEVLGRWLRLLHDLPGVRGLSNTGSALV